MARIAWLGLGAMGRRMAHRLLAAGHELTVWNRTLAACDELVAAGARRAATPRDAAADADAVWAMVYDDAASRAVWLDDAHGAAAALRADALAIESSTLSPQWVGELAAALTARAARFVDAPVAGSRPQAEAGQLIVMAGGEAEAVERLRALAAPVAQALHHVGPAGHAAWLKLAVNSLFATQVAAIAELLGLLRDAQLDVPRAWSAMRALPVVGAAAAGAGQLMLAGDHRAQAPIDLIGKDLAYALQAAHGAGASLPVTAAVKARLDAAHAAGWGGENIVALAKLHPARPA